MKTNHPVRTSSRFRGAALLLALLAAAAGARCSNCQGGGSKSSSAILDHVPQDSAFVLLAPTISAALGGAKSLFDQFRDRPPLSLLVTQRKAQLVQELGFDPENLETLKAKGIDPQGGLVATLDAAGEQLALVFKSSNGKALEGYLREMAQKSVGSDVAFKESKEGGLKVTQVQRQGKDEVLAAWSLSGDVALLCPMAPQGKHVACLKRVVKPAKSIRDSAEFNKLLERVGDHQVVAYINAAALKSALGKELDRQAQQAGSAWQKDEMLSDLQAGAVGLQLSAKGIQAKAFALQNKQSLDKIRKLVSGADKDAELTKLVGPDALVVLRFSVVAQKLLERVRQELKKASPEAAQQHQAELALADELVAPLAGRYVLALYPPAPGALKQALAAGDAMAALSAVSALAAAQVQDEGKAQSALDKVLALLQEQQVPVKLSRGKQNTYSIEGPQQAQLVSWTLSDKLLLAGNQPRIQNALKRKDGDGDNVLATVKSPVAKRLLEGQDSFVLYLSVGKTLDWLRSAELPPEVKMIITSAVAPLSKVQELVIGSELKEDGIAAELQLLVGN